VLGPSVCMGPADGLAYTPYSLAPSVEHELACLARRSSPAGHAALAALGRAKLPTAELKGGPACPGDRVATPSRAQAVPDNIATCWEGLKLSGRMLVACAFVMVAVGEVLASAIVQAISSEEPIEVTLARGTLKRISLGPIPEEEEEQDDERIALQ